MAAGMTSYAEGILTVQMGIARSSGHILGLFNFGDKQHL